MSPYVFTVIVCPSVHHKRCSIETTRRIELVFRMEAAFHLLHTVL